MTDAAIELEPQEPKPPESKEEIKEEERTPDEIRALNHNWVPKDQYQGNPDDWVSAKTFNERGEFIGKIRGLEKRLKDSTEDFSGRLDNQRKLHEIQLSNTISELESKRREAIESADVDKAESIQGNIDKMRSQIADTKTETKVTTAPQPENEADNEYLTQWDKDNPWIYDNSPKAAYGSARFNFHRSRGLSTQEAVKFMESEISNQFPPFNHNRQQAANVENGGSTTKKAATLSWEQLTAKEKSFYSPRMFNSKEQFCQTVQDDRT